jgi:Mlc titration factor MtfA (ptsG expression regulator)
LVKRITDDEKRMIMDSFISGTKKSEISKKFEISISTVNRIINSFQAKPVQRNKIEDILESSLKGDKTIDPENISENNDNYEKNKVSSPEINSEVMDLAKNLSELNLNMDQIKAIINTAKKIRKAVNNMESVNPERSFSVLDGNDFTAVNEFIEYYNQKQEMQSQLESVKSEKERHEKIRNDLVNEIFDLETKLSSLAIKIGKSEQTIKRMGYLLGDAENKGKVLQLKLEGMTETAAISKAFDDIIRNDRISYGSISLLNRLPIFKDLTEEEARKKILQMLDNFLLNHDEDSNFTGKRLPKEELIKLREDSYLLSDIMKELDNISQQKDSIITYMQAQNIFTILAEKLSRFREMKIDPSEIVVTVETIGDRIKLMDGKSVRLGEWNQGQ